MFSLPQKQQPQMHDATQCKRHARFPRQKAVFTFPAVSCAQNLRAIFVKPVVWSRAIQRVENRKGNASCSTVTAYVWNICIALVVDANHDCSCGIEKAAIHPQF
jgi:hypothetical protein